MINRRAQNMNRPMDYSRPQYGYDRLRTQNTSSSYEKDYQDFRNKPQDHVTDDDEIFLDDYRKHHGLQTVQDPKMYEEDDFEFRQNGDYGDIYTERGDVGFGKYFGRGPKGYQRSDERIYEDICEMLYHHPQIDASHIEVKVKDGNVSLTGKVENRQIKYLVEDEVERRAGVKEIENLLKTR